MKDADAVAAMNAEQYATVRMPFSSPFSGRILGSAHTAGSRAQARVTDDATGRERQERGERGAIPARGGPLRKPTGCRYEGKVGLSKRVRPPRSIIYFPVLLANRGSMPEAGMPFLQKDVLALMENKAISRPQPPPQPPPPIGGGSLSARPMYGSRPRSALGDRSNEEREQLQRPTTSDGNSRRIAGYTFPPGSSPRPEVLVANRMAGRSHSISALEAARRHRLGTIDPGEPDVDELLPPLSGVPFQLPSKDSYWFDQSSLQQGDLGGMEGLPPPQRPPSIVDGLLSTSMADVAEGGDVIGRVAPAAAPGGTSPPSGALGRHERRREWRRAGRRRGRRSRQRGGGRRRRAGGRRSCGDR